MIFVVLSDHLGDFRTFMEINSIFRDIPGCSHPAAISEALKEMDSKYPSGWDKMETFAHLEETANGTLVANAG